MTQNCYVVLSPQSVSVRFRPVLSGVCIQMSAMRAAVELFKAWHSTAPMLVYTGRTGNANKLARIQPPIDAFCREIETFLRDTLGCKPSRGG